MDSSLTPNIAKVEAENRAIFRSAGKLAPFERFAAGIVGLDDILEGGLPRDHLYLIEGDPWNRKNNDRHAGFLTPCPARSFSQCNCMNCLLTWDRRALRH
jgi:hypothetical protein